MSGWQRKLGTVDSVLTLWRDVCRKWQALESIFVGSEDIRVQLPEDSRRFDGVNVDFQDLQRLAPVRAAAPPCMCVCLSGCGVSLLTPATSSRALNQTARCCWCTPPPS